MMNITFDVLKKACEYNGNSWQDSENCNHSEFTYQGELDGYSYYDEGYIIRSDQACNENTCPFLRSAPEEI